MGEKEGKVGHLGVREGTHVWRAVLSSSVFALLKQGYGSHGTKKEMVGGCCCICQSGRKQMLNLRDFRAFTVWRGKGDLQKRTWESRRELL